VVGLTLESGSIAPLPDSVVDFVSSDPGVVSIVCVHLLVHPQHEVPQSLLNVLVVGHRQAAPPVTFTSVGQYLKYKYLIYYFNKILKIKILKIKLIKLKFKKN